MINKFNLSKNAIIIFIIALTIFKMFILSSCLGYGMREYLYYSNEENFITDVAVVKEIHHDPSSGIILYLSEVDDPDSYDVFIVEKKSVNGIMLIEIQPGDVIEYVSAPEIFGDGYAMPIVALSKGDEVLLKYEKGYADLMELKRKRMFTIF